MTIIGFGFLIGERSDVGGEVDESLMMVKLFYERCIARDSAAARGANEFLDSSKLIRAGRPRLWVKSPMKLQKKNWVLDSPNFTARLPKSLRTDNRRSDCLGEYESIPECREKHPLNDGALTSTH